ncbi:hypothetical protein [Nocardia acidivorans]|uniref:hypothetical protein n=1 Tax=Nocardia acidivorans TaxID=404580 RepID=UPI00083569BD|nr:hypothetical protein [Nocardia acidivorans]
MNPEMLQTILSTYDETADLLRGLGHERVAANVETLRRGYEDALDLAQRYFAEAHQLTHQLADQRG